MHHLDKHNKNSHDALFKAAGFFATGAILYGIIAMLLWLTGASLVIYILYRIATHPW